MLSCIESHASTIIAAEERLAVGSSHDNDSMRLWVDMIIKIAML